MAKKYRTGVIIGRFQVPDLHYGHINFICQVMDNHEDVLVLLGTTVAKGTIENPLDFKTRKVMLESQFPNIRVAELPDFKSDEEWSEHIDKIIFSHTSSACLYGGRDSFLNSYKGKYPVKEFKSKHHYAGTLVRQEIGKVIENNSSFRKGIIYSTQNQWPKVYPTVDMAIIKFEKNIHQVLLGKRKNSDELRFPGGFVDPTDFSLEDAVIREAKEETGLDLCFDNLEYVSSRLINDWRYKGRDKIMTTFYKYHISNESSLLAKAGDDLAEVDWYAINKVKISNNHAFLLKDLKTNLGVKNVN